MAARLLCHFHGGVGVKHAVAHDVVWLGNELGLVQAIVELKGQA